MKAVVLLSDGLDSPVAACLMLSKDVALHLLHMDNSTVPSSDQDDKIDYKIIGLAKHLHARYNRRIELTVMPHGEIVQKAIFDDCNRHYQCVLCKRMMYRLAERLAVETGATAIITGDSLGQVASQTLRNLMIEEDAVGIPVIRPLIGLDKEEIIEIAKQRGTYDISIKPGIACAFVPNKPKTYADLDTVKKE